MARRNVAERINIPAPQNSTPEALAQWAQSLTPLLTDVFQQFGYAINNLDILIEAGDIIDDRVANLIQDGTGLSWTYDDPNDTLTGDVTLAPFDTDDLSEGAGNLYYSDERVDDRVSSLVQDGTGLSWTYDDGANTLTGDVTLAPFDTDDLSEGAGNLYYTDARVDARLDTDQTITGAWTFSTPLNGNLEMADGGFTANESSGTWFDAVVTDNSISSIFRGRDSAGNVIGSIITRSLDGAGGGNLDLGGNEWTIRGGATIWGSDNLADTDDLSEGASNLYYTDARVDARLDTDQTINGAWDFTDVVDVRINGGNTHFGFGGESNYLTSIVSSTLNGATWIREYDADTASYTNIARFETGTITFFSPVNIDGNKVPRIHSGSFTTASLSSGSTEQRTITHGLGTDNVMVSLMGAGTSGGSSWRAAAERPDGLMVAVTGGQSSASSIGAATPGSGDVNIQVQNYFSGGADTITIQYMITALD